MRIFSYKNLSFIVNSLAYNKESSPFKDELSFILG